MKHRCWKCGKDLIPNSWTRIRRAKSGTWEFAHPICPAKKDHRKIVRPAKNGRLRGGAWKKRVQECFVRDGFKCRECGSTQWLDAHHIIFRSDKGSDELSNLITLCRTCHNLFHPEKRVRFGECRAQAIRDFNRINGEG